ncbi:lasso peptide biosynthesis B2 protein [Burkholderia sp. Bp8963]|uniref:lasso peptide biosynthesis B2 protein n=1 Tax=Burkholderia sp. Bp8963 TaxID=2184547 RepID=UPI000F5972D5|nr:lasso peptide biosynthesis B2 protein [Burkholderia sp. Bp8963]RQS61217.1 lasso peptide biosynthesis B2 protein [Burkholderia sp. Bp8963]
MRYALSQHARLAYYEDDLIILTIYDNRFHLIKDISRDAVDALFEPMAGQRGSGLRDALRIMGVLEESCDRADTPPAGLRPQSYVEQRWMMPLTRHAPATFLGIAASLAALYRATLMIKLGGFRRIVSMRKGAARMAPGPIDVDGIVQASMANLNRVFACDVSGNRCLTYSLALTLLLRRKISNVVLVVGVRTRPFFSHAWVEVDGRVVSDAVDLRKNLAVILEV